MCLDLGNQELFNQVSENKGQMAARLEQMDKDINFKALLEKYGPEGLYEIADKLKELADEDMRTAMEQDKIINLTPNDLKEEIKKMNPPIEQINWYDFKNSSLSKNDWDRASQVNFTDGKDIRTLKNRS